MASSTDHLPPFLFVGEYYILSHCYDQICMHMMLLLRTAGTVPVKNEMACIMWCAAALWVVVIEVGRHELTSGEYQACIYIRRFIRHQDTKHTLKATQMSCAFTHSLRNDGMIGLVMGAVFFFSWASQHPLWRFYLN